MLAKLLRHHQLHIAAKEAALSSPRSLEQALSTRHRSSGDNDNDRDRDASASPTPSTDAVRLSMERLLSNLDVEDGKGAIDTNF